MHSQGNHYLAYLSSNEVLEQKPRRILRESSPNIRESRHALRIRTSHQPQHRVFKSQPQARATIKQPYQSPRTTEILGTPEEIARLEIEHEAEFQWIWARAWQCERYNTYRGKKADSKPGGSEGGPKAEAFDWPDHYEMAFWRAIVMYRPRDRAREKSARDANKDLGRNESIAEYLELKFGRDIWPLPTKNKKEPPKGRKIVSSHIQVLRGHFSLPKVERELDPPPPNPFQDVLEYFPKQKAKKGAETSLDLQAAVPYYRHFLPFAPAQGHMAYNFKPSCFQMYIRHQHTEQRLHDITKLRDNSEPMKVSVVDAQDQICQFPDLKDLLAGKTLACPVMLAEATFRLPNLEHFTAEKELCIEQAVTTSRRLADNCVWSTRTRIMEEMGEYVFQEKIEPKEARGNTCDIKFRSAYWVNLLTRYDAMRRIKVKQEYTIGGGRYDAPSRVSDHLRGIRAVQEIISTPSWIGGVGEPERHLIICWTFKEAEYGEPGLTQWRELVIPPTLPTMSHDYPSPDASYKAESDYCDKLNLPFDLYNNTPVSQGLGISQAAPYMQDAWSSPNRAMPYYGAISWPSVHESQSMIPRSFALPTFDVTSQPIAQELYTASEYLSGSSFGMTPPDSTIMAKFAQGFDSATTSDSMLTPDSGEDSQGAEYTQGIEYSQGGGYSQTSVPQFLDDTIIDHTGLESQSSHIYAPQAQYTHLPLNTSFIYDQSLQDFSSFNRVIDDDLTVGGLEYSFHDHIDVPILPSQPITAAETQDSGEDASLSHLRLTAAYDPNFFGDCQAGMLDIPHCHLEDRHGNMMSHCLANASEQADEQTSLLQRMGN